MRTVVLNVFRGLATAGSVIFAVTVVPRMYKMQREPGKSKDLLPAFVPMMMVLNGSIWTFYGLVTQDVAIAATNIWATFVGYNCFVWYMRGVESQKRFNFGHYVFVGGLFTIIILAACWAFIDSFTKDNFISVISIIGGVVATLVFVTPFTAMIDVIRTRSSEAISLPYAVVALVLSVFWTIVGFGMPAVSVWVPNLIGIIMSTLQVLLFFIFPRKKSQTEDEVSAEVSASEEKGDVMIVE